MKIEQGKILETPFIIVEPAGSPAKRGVTIRNQLSKAPEFGSIHASLVLLHGRKGRKDDLLPVAERFCAVGFRCILIDLPGHGESSLEESHFGTTVSESTLSSRVFAVLKEDYQWRDQPTHLLGISMGGAFANASLYASPEVWDSAIIINSFDRLSSVIDRKLERVSFFQSVLEPLTYKFCSFPIDKCEPATWAKDIQTPVLVIHGDSDALITHAQGKTLYESYQSEDKQFVSVPGGTHTNVLVTAYPLYKTMVEWLMAHSSQSPPSLPAVSR